nr:50S ribosomal protein L10 [Candidatus Korarchaeota archaeon]
GDIISERLAVVLSKLGMKPVEAGLAMRLAYDDGVIITEEQLQIDLQRTRQDIRNAYSDTLALSLTIAYPTTENIEMLIQAANQESYALAINAAIPTRKTIKYLIRKAETEATSLTRKISSQSMTKELAEE